MTNVETDRVAAWAQALTEAVDDVRWGRLTRHDIEEDIIPALIAAVRDQPVSDAEVEAAARGLHDEIQPGESWDNVTDFLKEHHWGRAARAALAAAREARDA